MRKEKFRIILQACVAVTLFAGLVWLAAELKTAWVLLGLIPSVLIVTGVGFNNSKITADQLDNALMLIHDRQQAFDKSASIVLNLLAKHHKGFAKLMVAATDGTDIVDCPACKGESIINAVDCPTCKGAGFVTSEIIEQWHNNQTIPS